MPAINAELFSRSGINRRLQALQFEPKKKTKNERILATYSKETRIEEEAEEEEEEEEVRRREQVVARGRVLRT